MRNILEEVRYEVPGRFFGFNIFLAANMAIPAHYLCIAVQTVFFGSFFKMAQP